jgi:polyisoprenoid-binding protein YceI
MVSRAALACRMLVELPLVSLTAASVWRGQVRYLIDHRLGPIEVAVDHCGLFNARGRLGSFTGSLAFDRADPLDVRVDLELDVRSITLTEWDEKAWLPFGPWFDVAAHPIIRFRSSAVVPSGRDRFAARGLLEVGGVTRLLTLDAVLTGRKADPITETEVAELLITGSSTCSAFGMPRDLVLISDRVELRLSVRIELDA